MKTLTQSEAALAAQMQPEILGTLQDANSVLTSSQAVGPIFHAHYVNMEDGKHGIAALIAEILTEAEAIFPLKIEDTEFRPIAIAKAMFADEIIAKVQARFTAGSKRYPYHTVHTYLSVHMVKSGKVGKIYLSNKEDAGRTCCKPRIKFYLIEGAQ